MIGPACAPALEDREALTAWRCWFVLPDEGLLRPIYRRGLVWKPREVMEAVCPDEHHEVPDNLCKCGVWAASEPRHLHEVRWTFDPPEGVSQLPGILVVGQVSMWGRVIEYDRGWRASHAYPKHLYAFTKDAALAATLRDTYLVPVEHGDKAEKLGELLPPAVEKAARLRKWTRHRARKPRSRWEKWTETDEAVTISSECLHYDAREHLDEAEEPQLLQAVNGVRAPGHVAWARPTGRFVVMLVVYDPRDGDNPKLWTDVCVLRRKRGDEYRIVETMLNPKDPFRTAEAKFDRLRATR